MRSLLTRRAILVTGKGGVGKTTLAAAIARLAAFQGKRVLVAEIAADSDAPSPLAAVLGREKSSEYPFELAPGIRGVTLTPSIGHRFFLQDVLPMKLMADAALRSGVVRRFLSAAPAFAEMGILYRMLNLLREERSDGEPEHQICIIDCPATGHTLALTQMPEMVLKVVSRGPIGKAVRDGMEILTDPMNTAALVVTLAESLPVSEALELVEGLSKHKVPLAGMLVNRVPNNPFSVDERAQIDKIDASHGPLIGQGSLRRIDRANAAWARLEQFAKLPLMKVPEITGLNGGKELLYEQIALSLAEEFIVKASRCP